MCPTKLKADPGHFSSKYIFIISVPYFKVNAKIIISSQNSDTYVLFPTK